MEDRREPEAPQRSRFEVTLPHPTDRGPEWDVIERSPAAAAAGEDWEVIGSALSYSAAVAILEAVQVVT